MKTTLALLTAVIGLATSVQAGPSTPGVFFQQPGSTNKVVLTSPPTGPQCSTKKLDWTHTHGGGGFAITRTVNCTGQKCCVANTPSCCPAKRQ